MTLKKKIIIAVLVVMGIIIGLGSGKKEAKPVIEEKPLVGFLVEDPNQNLVVTFECKGSEKGSGYNIVYRDYQGNLVDSTGYNLLFHVQTKGGTQTQPWRIINKMQTGQWPQADAFMNSAFEAVNKVGGENVEFVFIITKDKNETPTARRFVMGGTSVALVAANALQQQCAYINKNH